MVDKKQNFAKYICPQDCPFRDRFDDAVSWYCSYGIYGEFLDTSRTTRTEVFADGSVDYHVPPNCDIYERYVDKTSELSALKKQYKTRYLIHHKPAEPDLEVTGHKHPATTKHHGDF